MEFKINYKHKQEIEVGDLLILESDSKLLVVKKLVKVDGDNKFVGFTTTNLSINCSTVNYGDTLEELYNKVDNESGIKQIIKGKNLLLTEKL